MTVHKYQEEKCTRPLTLYNLRDQHPTITQYYKEASEPKWVNPDDI